MSQKRTWLAMLSVGAALALGACGGGDEETDEPPPEEAVEQAITDYGAAEGSATCDYVSEEAIESVGGIEECEKAFEESTPTEYDIQEVQVDGDQATATAKRESTGETDEFKLVNEDGEWKVDPR